MIRLSYFTLDLIKRMPGVKGVMHIELNYPERFHCLQAIPNNPLCTVRSPLNFLP